MNWVALSRKMIWVAESNKNWFEGTKNMKWSESTVNWFESIENMDCFVIFKNWFKSIENTNWFDEIFKNWFESVKDWVEEVKKKGISDGARNFLVGAVMVPLLVAAVICLCQCGCFFLNIILTTIGQMILFILRCGWVLLKPIRWAILFILKCCGVQLMKAPGLAIQMPRALFSLCPRIYFLLLRLIR